MSKMHELLAVESSINGSYNKIVQETLNASRSWTSGSFQQDCL